MIRAAKPSTSACNDKRSGTCRADALGRHVNHRVPFQHLCAAHLACRDVKLLEHGAHCSRRRIPQLRPGSQRLRRGDLQIIPRQLHSHLQHHVMLVGARTEWEGASSSCSRITHAAHSCGTADVAVVGSCSARDCLAGAAWLPGCLASAATPWVQATSSSCTQQHQNLYFSMLNRIDGTTPPALGWASAKRVLGQVSL